MLITATLLALALFGGVPAQTPLTVSAAASLTDALQEAGRAYRQAGGGEVRFNFAASNTLARQIVAGAPVDLFVSADEAQMDVVQKAGEVAAGSRVDLLGNRLAVVTPTAGRRMASVGDLADPAVHRIALGDPAAVPAGVYAQRYLEAAGIWSQIESRVIPAANVRAALAAAASGSVDAAIVYESDVASTHDISLAFVVSGGQAPRIVYPAAVLARSSNKDEAAKFLAFLKSATASAIFQRYKFVPLSTSDGQR